MDNVVDGNITIDDYGIIDTFNPAAERMFGYAVGDIRGQNVKVLMPEPDRGDHDDYIANYRRTEKGTIIGMGAREVRGLRKDGSTFPMELDVSVMYAGGKRCFIGVARDISLRKETEAQLQQAQKMEAVGQLTGGVAHDFNNLLAVILGNTELLENELGDNPLLATIDRAATRGAELTQRLLTFARQQALQPQSIDLMELIPGLHDLFHRTLGEPVKISMDVPEGIWPVTADPGQLENALLNLAINARDAMPEGGTLEISCENVQLHDNDKVAAGDYVQIAVRDSGSGMPEDVLEHAFEPFYTTKDVGEGSGLGLSMVYGFARQSGGDATIESKPGAGTEVKLLLPRSEVTNMSDEPLRGKDRKRGQGEAILVLEDDPDVRSFAVAALEGLG
jgi:PAS domain S-box-containing protein